MDLKIGQETGDKDEIDGTVADHLVGDPHAAALRISGLRRSHEECTSQRPGSNAVGIILAENQSKCPEMPSRRSRLIRRRAARSMATAGIMRSARYGRVDVATLHRPYRKTDCTAPCPLVALRVDPTRCSDLRCWCDKRHRRNDIKLAIVTPGVAASYVYCGKRRSGR